MATKVPESGRQSTVVIWRPVKAPWKGESQTVRDKADGK